MPVDLKVLTTGPGSGVMLVCVMCDLAQVYEQCTSLVPFQSSTQCEPSTSTSLQAFQLLCLRQYHGLQGALTTMGQVLVAREPAIA